MDILDRYLGYEAWTLRHFINRCREISPAQMQQAFDVGPGSIQATLHHIIGNLEVWTDLMREHPVRKVPPLPATIEATLEPVMNSMGNEPSQGQNDEA